MNLVISSDPLKKTVKAFCTHFEDKRHDFSENPKINGHMRSPNIRIDMVLVQLDK